MHFEQVADILIADWTEVKEDEWDTYETARYRSAISRSYYAVFRAIKRTATTASPGLDYPQRGVHAIIRRALRRAQLKPILAHVTSLVAMRELADYDLRSRHLYEDAEAAVDDAFSAVRLIDDLAPGQVQTLAFCIDTERRNFEAKR